MFPRHFIHFNVSKLKDCEGILARILGARRWGSSPCQTWYRSNVPRSNFFRTYRHIVKHSEDPCEDLSLFDFANVTPVTRSLKSKVVRGITSVCAWIVAGYRGSLRVKIQHSWQRCAQHQFRLIQWYDLIVFFFFSYRFALPSYNEYLFRF